MLPDDLFAQLSRSAALRLRYNPGLFPCFEDWKRQIRARLSELLRSDLWPAAPLTLSVTACGQGEGFTRERIDFEAGPLFSGSAYLLIPARLQHPVPGILCLHGHGGYMAGKDMVAGNRNASDRQGMRGGTQLRVRCATGPSRLCDALPGCL